MRKRNWLPIIAVAIFAASTAFAGDKPCCATGASNDMKAACEATFAKLDLTAQQKTKMEKLAAECDKEGCTKESMATMEKGAKGVLSKKQFATWRAACSGKMAEKTQS
jgi:hypothetical protein